MQEDFDLNLDLLEQKKGEARSLPTVGGMRPCVYAHKDLRGQTRLGVRYCHPHNQVGDRQHVDYGLSVKTERNEDALILFIVE